MIYLLNSPWDDSSLLIVIGEAEHCESLSCSGLPIAHDCTVVARNNALHNGSSRDIINIILGSIVKDGIELELPVILLIVDGTMIRLLFVDEYLLYRINIEC